MNSLEPVTRGASPERTQGDVDETQQYLTFLLGDEAFAMDIRAVREIIQPSSMTIVPLMPEFVRGVINLRGSVVPVIDLSARFGRQRVQSGKKTSIIIYDARQQEDKQELGVMVDAVAEVVDIPDSAMEPASTNPREPVPPVPRGLATAKHHAATIEGQRPATIKRPAPGQT